MRGLGNSSSTFRTVGFFFRSLMPLISTRFDRIPLPLDQLPQDGLFIQTMHDGLEVPLSPRCGINLLQQVSNLNGLHPSVVSCPPLHSRALNDAKARNDR
jgi:hypothetical protein